MSAAVADAPPETEPRVYGFAFFLAFAANLSLVTANALTFRFAELVHFLGGSERVAGAIVGAGMVGALVARLFLGQAIDFYGVRRLWLAATVSLVTGCLGFVTAGDLGWPIYAARVCFNVGIAGMFTCSIVHIQNQVPPHRRTEVIGTLGSSGFLGMMIGSLFGDAILNVFPPGGLRYQILFGSSAALGTLYGVLVLVLTWHDRHDRPHATPGLHRLAFKHWPGMVMLVASLMGVVFTVVSVFLTRFATHLDLAGIGPFFTGYAISAFSFRVLTRNWNRWIGRHRLILLGCGGHLLGCLSFTLVENAWHLVIPSIALGFGHALLFPAVVSIGAGAFPREYRGSGTTLVLGFTEVGAMIGAPLLGAIIDGFGSDGGGFQAMFLAAAGLALGTGILYALTAARTPDEDLDGTFDKVPAVPPKMATERAPRESFARERCTVAAGNECGRRVSRR